MTHASTPPFPGTKILAGWWSRFAPDATALLAGTFPVTRVEIAFRDRELAPPDPLLAAVLRVLHTLGNASAVELDRILHLGEARVEASLRDAVELQLLEPPVRSVYAARLGPAPSPPAFRTVVLRRMLCFRDGNYLPLPPGPLGSDGEGAGLPVGRWVREAVSRSEEWKRAAQFPLDLRGEHLAEVESDGWRAIPLVAGECVTGVVVRSKLDAVALFPASGTEWILPAEPTFAIACQDAFPELFQSPPESELRAAWQGWARSRSVPTEQLTECGLELDGAKLRVRVPANLEGWLRSNRGDIFRGETWVWVGSGSLRRAAVLEVTG